jgi:hypothetical protein
LGEEGSKKEKVVHIKNWPEGERPREMLLAHGPEALTDAALLAILLRTGRQGKDAVALAREMLSELGGFQGLLSASYEDLLKIKGIGRAKIAQILAAMEIVKRQLRQPLKKLNVIQSPSALFEYLKVSMGRLNKEEFRLLHLNRAKALLFSWSGNRGTSFGPYRWEGPRGYLNQHIFKVTAKDGVNKKWLFHALHLAKEKTERRAHGGSGLVHVKRGELLSYRIPTPGAEEQRRIAEILDTIDEAIQKTETLIEKLKAIKQGLLHDLLTRGLDENGKLRNPKAHPEQFKDSPLGSPVIGNSKT